METAKAMRDTLREGGITRPGRLALYIGGTAVSAAIGSAVLNLVHHTPWWLLVVSFLGLMVMAWGGIVIKTEKGLHDATRANEPLESRLSAPQGGTGTQGSDKRIALNEYRRRGAELDAAPPDEALAREWSDIVVKFLSEEGWPFADVERFQNAGTGTAANRLRPRADVLGALIARLGNGAIVDESGSEPAEDGQIGMKPDTVDSTDPEGEQ